MAFAKTIAATVALFATIQGSTGCSCVGAPWTPCDYVSGSVPGYDEGLVIRADIVSRSTQDDTNDPVTYTAEVTAVFKGAAIATMSFTSPGNEALCGVNLEIGADYVLAFKPVSEGQYSIEACGFYKKWDELAGEETDELEAGCAAKDPCLGSCDEYQECVQYERNEKYYCSDTCDNNPCASGEVCSTKTRKWCRASGFDGCPQKRTCMV